jgi:hypothetical protein
MSKTLRINYTISKKSVDNTGHLPFIPILLSFTNQKVLTSGLLDTGSTINVMPFSIGLELGLKWDKMNTKIPLTGNLSTSEAFGVVIKGKIDDFKTTNLVFAWTKNDQIPLILGQTNFFQEYNVCFFRSEFFFEIKEK